MLHIDEVLDVFESLYIPSDVDAEFVYQELVQVYEIINNLKLLGVRLTENFGPPLDAGLPV